MQAKDLQRDATYKMGDGQLAAYKGEFQWPKSETYYEFRTTEDTATLILDATDLSRVGPGNEEVRPSQ